MRNPLLVLLFAATLLVAACGGDDDGDSSQNTPPVSVAPTGPTGATAPSGTTGRKRSRNRKRSRDSNRNSGSNSGTGTGTGSSKGSKGSVKRNRSDDSLSRTPLFDTGGPKFRQKVTRNAARAACKKGGVRRMAKFLKVDRDPQAIARKFSKNYRKGRRESAYRGCLEGLGG